MANRRIPYGYMVDMGEIRICDEESEIVKEIFVEYISGDSLTVIAGALTEKGLRYHPDEDGWNKHMVKRILEDKRYLGTGIYPQIISKDDFDEADRIRSLRKEKQGLGKNRDILSASCPVICEKCGGEMTRKHDKRRGNHTYWRCRRPRCGTRAIISDTDLNHRLLNALNHIICRTDIISTPCAADAAPLGQASSSESERMSGDVIRMLGSADIDRERLREKIFACASERYRELDGNAIMTELIKADFGKRSPLFNLDGALLERTVKGISLSAGGAVNLIMKNGQTIRGGGQYERTEHADEPSAENRQADSA